MKAIICDRCGKTQRDTYYITTAEVTRLTIGYPKEVHLCSTCTEEFIEWVQKRGGNHDNRPSENA